MKNSWTTTFRRLAAGALVAGAAAFSSAQSYAAIAYDDASDPVYNDGWQGQTHDDFGAQLTTGDNGGFGFTQWNFDSSYWWYGDPNRVFNYGNPGVKGIDNGLGTSAPFSNPNNNIGRSWVMGQDATLKDVNRAGRGFAPLQIGDTLNVLIDNPTVRPIGGGFTGYFIRLNGNTGGTNGNICQGFGGNCTAHNPPEFPSAEMRFSNFHQDPNAAPGEWAVIDTTSAFSGLTDVQSGSAGVLLKVTRVNATDYEAVLDTLGLGLDYSVTKTFSFPGDPIDWIEFTFFNASATATNTTGFTDTATTPTDLYIRSMEITAIPEPGSGVLLVFGTLAGLGATRPRKGN